MPEIGYILLRCWPNGPHGKPQTSQAIESSPQIDDKSIKLQKALPFSLNKEKSSWCLTRYFNPFLLVLMVLEDALHDIKEESKPPNQLQTLQSMMVTCLQNMLVQ